MYYKQGVGIQASSSWPERCSPTIFMDRCGKWLRPGHWGCLPACAPGDPQVFKRSSEGHSLWSVPALGAGEGRKEARPWPAVSAESEALHQSPPELASGLMGAQGRQLCMLQRGEHCQSGSGRHGTWGPKGQRQVCAPASSTGRHVGPEAGRTAEPARDWRGQPHPCWPGAHTTLCLAAPPPSCSCFCDLGGFA